MEQDGRRRCEDCGCRLARDNLEQRCASCQRKRPAAARHLRVAADAVQPGRPGAAKDLEKALGELLVALRKASGLTQKQLSHRIGYSRSTVGSGETGGSFPAKHFWESCDDVLRGNGRLRQAYAQIETARAERVRERARQAELKREAAGNGRRAGLGLPASPQPGPWAGAATLAGQPEFQLFGGGRSLALTGDQGQIIAGLGEEAVVMSIDRRAFLTSSGIAIPVAALEIARHRFDLSLVAERTIVDLDEWQEIIWEYGHSYNSTPPTQLLDALLVDLVALDAALERQPGEPARRQLRSAGALLAAFMAQTIANLGDVHQAGRWWRTARHAADQSGDLHTVLWVRGREVVRALYEQRPVAAILRLLDQAEPLSRTAVAADLPQFLCGKAQTLAVAGRPVEAENALQEVRDNLGRLPASTTGDRSSLFGWSEPNVLFTESFVYAHLGKFAKADKAQSAAISLYPVAYPRGPAQIELQRALCLVSSGDIATGVQHAQDVLVKLPVADHIRPVVDLGHKVLSAVPAAARSRTDVDTFRDYLASHGSA